MTQASAGKSLGASKDQVTSPHKPGLQATGKDARQGAALSDEEARELRLFGPHLAAMYAGWTSS